MELGDHKQWEQIMQIPLSWRFKSEWPLAFKIVSGAIILNFLMEFILITGLSFFAHAFPNGPDQFMIIRGKTMYFVRPWLGKYLTTGAWFQFVLLGLLVVVVLLNRSQIESD
jgi:hypothetical protein